MFCWGEEALLAFYREGPVLTGRIPVGFLDTLSPYSCSLFNDGLYPHT